jgi:peroxiredoxin
MIVVALGLYLVNRADSPPPDKSPLPARWSPGPQSHEYGKCLDEILAEEDLIPTHDHPLLGRKAPEFELADGDGKFWRLRDLLDGQPVVVVFYYGSHCLQCNRHLAEIDRDMPIFRQLGARVVAISAASLDSTERPGATSFPLLADPGNKVARRYQLFRRMPNGEMESLPRHGTFIIDGSGTVSWVNVGDAPFRRNPALLYQLAAIQGCFR